MTTPNRHGLRYTLSIILIATVYFGAAKFGFLFTAVHGSVTLLWPPTGIALAIILLFGQRFWPGIALGAFLANALTNGPISFAFFPAVGNTLEAVVGAYLLQHFGAFHFALDRTRDVISLGLFSAGLSTMVSATIGVIGLCFTGVVSWQEFGMVWLIWWLGDAIGALITAPFLLTWGTFRSLKWNSYQALEVSVWLLGLITLSALAFGGQISSVLTNFSLAYLCFPFVIWAALRFGQRGVGTAILIISAIVVWAALRGLGAFAPTVNETFLFLWAYMAVLAVTGLFLAAAISERKSTEAALRANETRFRLLMNNLNQVFWLRTPDFPPQQLIYISPAYESIYGRSQQSAYDNPMSILESVHPEDFQAVLAASTHNSDTRFRVIHTDGSIRWLLTHSFPIYNDEGKVYLVAGITADVTEHQRAEEQARDLALEKDRLRLLNNFIRDISHDFRTPLATIQTSAYLIYKLDDAEKRKEHAQIISDKIEHMTKALTDMLMMAELDNITSLAKSPVMLNKLVADTMDAMNALIASKHLILVQNFDTVIGQIETNAEELGHALSKIVENSVEFTPDGGTITIQTCYEKGKAVIEVHDTGAGIPGEDLPHIFERLYRADKARSQDFSGLGLSIAKRIVTLLDGWIEVKSTMGQGSVFRIVLPHPVSGQSNQA